MQFVNMLLPGSLKSILDRKGREKDKERKGQCQGKQRKGKGNGNGQVGMQFVNMSFPCRLRSILERKAKKRKGKGKGKESTLYMRLKPGRASDMLYGDSGGGLLL